MNVCERRARARAFFSFILATVIKNSNFCRPKNKKRNVVLYRYYCVHYKKQLKISASTRKQYNVRRIPFYFVANESHSRWRADMEEWWQVYHLIMDLYVPMWDMSSSTHQQYYVLCMAHIAHSIICINNNNEKWDQTKDQKCEDADTFIGAASCVRA